VRDNQLVHSQLIRDALILVQSTISTWAKADGQTHLLPTQRKSWQAIVPYMDTLTTLRLHIETLETKDSQNAIRNLIKQLSHQLCALHISQDLSLQQHLHEDLLARIADIDADASADELKQRLYRITSQLSELIFHCYDRSVTTVAQSIYSTLPKIAVA
jgi:predicted house-cleaning noncanonical NTP pyrophosphatase (MazG superfamily)